MTPDQVRAQQPALPGRPPAEPPAPADAPLDTAAARCEQAGVPYLAGACPRCGQEMNVAGEGLASCRRCGSWLRFRKA